MKKLFLLMFVMVEIVLVLNTFISGLPTFMDDYIALLFLMFIIFNIMIFAILLQ